MPGRWGALVVASVATLTSVQGAFAQDVLGGALLGGAAGAIIGGAATGRGGGAVIGGLIGAGAGAAIASEGQRRRNGYYYYRQACYLQRPDGAYVRVSGRYCDEPVGYAPPPPPAPVMATDSDSVAWCARRYRSYDPRSGTFIGADGYRHPCP